MHVTKPNARDGIGLPASTQLLIPPAGALIKEITALHLCENFPEVRVFFSQLKGMARRKDAKLTGQIISPGSKDLDYGWSLGTFALPNYIGICCFKVRVLFCSDERQYQGGRVVVLK